MNYTDKFTKKIKLSVKHYDQYLRKLRLKSKQQVNYKRQIAPRHFNDNKYVNKQDCIHNSND